MSLEIKVTRLAARMVDVEGRQTDAAFFLHSVGLHATRQESLNELRAIEGYAAPTSDELQRLLYEITPGRNREQFEVMKAAGIELDLSNNEPEIGP